MTSRSIRFLLAAASALSLASSSTGTAATVTPAGPGSEVIGVVDGIPIRQREWDQLAGPYFQEVQARAGRPLTEEDRSLLKKNVLDELIRERLWIADAKRRGFTATDAEFDAHLIRNPYFQTDGKPDEAKLREFKRSPTSNYPEIKLQLTPAVLLEKYIRWMEKRYAPGEAEL